MDNETKDEIAEIVSAGLSSGTSMQTIKESVGQVTLKRWLLELGETYECKRQLRQTKRK